VFNKDMRKFIFLIAFGAAACVGSAGTEPPTQVPKDVQILFNGVDYGGQAINTFANNPLQLTARVIDGAGAEMSSASSVQFLSRDTTFATVDGTGLVTARRSGSAWIVARLPIAGGELRDSISVTFVCDGSAAFALYVTIKDSLSGATPSVVSNWRVRDVTGTFADSGLALDSFFSVNERVGTYRVDVTAPGYRDWSADNVVVTRGVCHVNRVNLTARLQRLTP
jgi:hypothetical protein